MNQIRSPAAGDGRGDRSVPAKRIVDHVPSTRGRPFREENEMKDSAANGARSRERLPSGSRPRRNSYDSIREVRSNVPQSFHDSKDRSRARKVSAGEGSEAPADSGRRKQSKSYVDLKRSAELDVLRAEAEATRVAVAVDEPDEATGLLDLPFEMIELILSTLVLDPRPNEWTPPNADLLSFMKVSKKLYAATLSSLYRNVQVPHSISFSKLMKRLREDPPLGGLVRRLDFSHYSSIGFGRTRQDSAQLRNVTPQTLLACLDLMPGLTEFLVHEHIEDELDGIILRRLFESNLRALDFCACSSRAFTGAITSTLLDQTAALPHLRRLSLHTCSTIQGPAFESLLPRLTNLTHLDVAHTLITDKALASIPQSARLTHLNLGRCTQVTGARVVDFLKGPCAAELVYLNLMAEPSRYTLLFPDHVEELLPILPKTLRSLNLGGAEFKASALPLLLPLTKHLEELGLGFAQLSIADLNSLFRPTVTVSNYDITEEEMAWRPWEPCTLRYLDLTGVSAISQFSLHHPSCILFSSQSYPLEVIELGEAMIGQLRTRSKSIKGFGWVVRELGRRGWFVRQPKAGDPSDDGSRPWKMGARWWGMRKVPVATQDVGGMYGHYMFKS